MAHSRDQQMIEEQVFEGVKILASFRGKVMNGSFSSSFYDSVYWWREREQVIDHVADRTQQHARGYINSLAYGAGCRILFDISFGQEHREG